MPELARVTGIGALLLVIGVGCNAQEEPVAPRSASPSSTEGAADAPSVPAAPGAILQGMVRVRGTVRLLEGSDLPFFTDEQIGRTAERPGLPEGCSPARASDSRPMRLSAERGVGGLLVTATGNPEHFQRLPASAARTIPLTIRDCRLEPSLVVAAVGDVIELTNRSPRAFMTTFTTNPVNEAQAPERTRRIDILRTGVQRVECSIASACGRTDVVVLAHRVASVTDAEGRFELDVPAGAEVVLHAWHPLMGRREGEARLTIDQAVAGSTRTLDIPLSLAPVPENPPVDPSPGAADPQFR